MMSEKDNKVVTKWLFLVCVLILGIVVFGGYVRLTRSGLSIVEWNPVSGIVPPIGEEAWQQEFAKYQATPEFQKVNNTMTLDGYKRIFYVEYYHRLIARFIGLLVVIPLFYFLFKGIIPWRKSGIYLAIALLFAFQGFMGWYMVSSGLRDIPAVSHFRLTIHLLMALLLLTITFWAGLNHYYRFPARIPGATKTTPHLLSIVMLIVLVIQISYGGLMAGLKAGYASNTFPLMFGRLVPQGLLSQLEPWWQNLVASTTTVHFIHRWFAFIVLGVAIYFYFAAKALPSLEYDGNGKPSLLNGDNTLRSSALWMMVLTAVQVTLGVTVIWFHVPIVLALLHQVTALVMFMVALFINYRLVHVLQGAEATAVASPLEPTTA